VIELSISISFLFCKHLIYLHHFAVGFTNKASNMSARDGKVILFSICSVLYYCGWELTIYSYCFLVVSMLNDIFSRFDHLCEVYDLSKYIL
jgi:hypothetical protein